MTTEEATSVFAPGVRLLTIGMVLIVTLVAFESMAVATVMPLVEDDLASGRLVAPIATAVRTSGAYYLAYPPNRPRPPRLAAFEDWIVAAAQRVAEG